MLTGFGVIINNLSEIVAMGAFFGLGLFIGRKTRRS
jgi:hypothetical protein